MATNVENRIDKIINIVESGKVLMRGEEAELVRYVKLARQANARRQEMINKLAAALDERDKMRAPSGDSSGTSRR